MSEVTECCGNCGWEGTEDELLDVAAGSRDSYFKTVWSLVGSYAFEHINHFAADIACAYESDEMASDVANRITNSIHSYRG